MEPLAPRLILVPTDFGPHAAQALRYAAALAGRFHAHLLVIYADTFVSPVDFMAGGGGALAVSREELIDGALEQLQRFVRTNVGDDAVACDFRVVLSTPGSAIPEVVHQTGANLIVMGTRGRTGLRRLLIGSVTETVMRTATVPVIAVHQSSVVDDRIRVIAKWAGSTLEDAAAVRFAGMLGGTDEVRFAEIPRDAGVLAMARAERADLIALGISGGRGIADVLLGTSVERIVQQSFCPVLTVNHNAAVLLETAMKAHEAEAAVRV